MASRILLILDLDETLIYAAERAEHGDSDFRIGPFYVYCRPHVTEFLEDVSAVFDLAFWSSGSSDYVEAIVEQLLPAGIRPALVWSRTRCIQRIDTETREYYYVKDLKKIKRLGYDLDRVVIVEDTPQKVERNYGNAVYVSSYFGDNQEDRELLQLARYLRSICDVPNVRCLEKRGWRSKVSFD